jgi:ABC-type branched-subunit amino acid transport system ATPase component
MLELKALAKNFGGNAAVKGVTCTFPTGKITGLIGPNGAGKTTIFNMITGNIRPSTGKVFFDGRDITGTPPHKVARLGIGRGFQKTRMFLALTVLENVVVALPDVSHTVFRLSNYSRARQNELDAKAKGFLDILGIAGLSGRRGSELSYGDQRTVMLACLLAAGGKTLLLDEPTGGIDPSARGRVLEQILSLCEMGRTIVLIEHNLDVVRGTCENVLFLAQGEVLASGTPAEIEADKRLTELYFGAAHA